MKPDWQLGGNFSRPLKLNLKDGEILALYDGEWEPIDEVIIGPDFADLKIGPLEFVEGEGPRVVQGTDAPIGFICNGYCADTPDGQDEAIGAFQIASSSINLRKAIKLAYDTIEGELADHPDELPSFLIAEFEKRKTKRGSFMIPKFDAVGWMPRPGGIDGPEDDTPPDGLDQAARPKL